MDVNKRLTAIALLLIAVASPIAEAQEPSRRSSLPTGVINWTTDYHEGLDQSVKSKKPVLLDFYAEWCGPCKMMDAQTYTDPRVIAALNDFITIKIDTDRDENTAFAYRIRSIPRTLSLNIHGEIVGDIVGFMDADEFLDFLREVKKDALTKIDGIVIPVPKSEDGVSAPSKAFDSTTALTDMIEGLVAIEPEVRAGARVELLRRDTEEVQNTLVAMLSHEYLGARIAAWETLVEMNSLDQKQFNPWATAALREKGVMLLTAEILQR